THVITRLSLFLSAASPAEIYTLSLHDALPISEPRALGKRLKLPISLPTTGGRPESPRPSPCRLISSSSLLSCSSASFSPSWLNRSEEHTSELQSRENLVCRLLLEKKKK